MKKLTIMLVAAALIAPAAASASAAHKVSTPGTQARHEMNLSADKMTSGGAIIVERSAQDIQEPSKKRPRAALAGKVNLAARSRN